MQILLYITQCSFNSINLLINIIQSFGKTCFLIIKFTNIRTIQNVNLQNFLIDFYKISLNTSDFVHIYIHKVIKRLQMLEMLQNTISIFSISQSVS